MKSDARRAASQKRHETRRLPKATRDVLPPRAAPPKEGNLECGNSVTLVTFAALSFGDKARQRVRREWAFRVSLSARF
ncbi:MAG: hypothetical protein IJF17_13940 [Thermoguttaceae bacterium]|nr:hypothetical protein [Thermoguttaceae bacterium]